MEFDRDNAGSSIQERSGQSSSAGTDVKDQIAGCNTGAVHNPFCPAAVKLVPTPLP